MTHDELLALLNAKSNSDEVHALRAVVEMHKSLNTNRFGEPIDICNGCFEITDDFIVYPCPTIRVITEHLQTIVPQVDEASAE